MRAVPGANAWLLGSRRMARVWVLTSGRTGDDKQSLRLASALGVAYEEKRICFDRHARPWRPMLGPGLRSVDPSRSSPLAAPWPDLVISSGWRQVPVVRWIKARSGGHTRLVQMNRPPGPKHFDLILSPPQFRVPLRDNVLRLDWPLQLPPPPEALERAREAWSGRLDRLPRPWTVVLLGGSSHPFELDRTAAERLFEGVLERARSRGGSLLVSTSRRTPGPALEVAQSAAAAAPETVFLYAWRPDAFDNPYVAFLAGGDEFVITPDSLSMLVEVARLGRPLAIAPHSRAHSPWKSARTSLKRLLHGPTDRPQSPARAISSDLASFLGLKFVRDLDGVSRRMVEVGVAADFPAFAGGLETPLPDDDLERAAARIRELLAESEST